MTLRSAHHGSSSEILLENQAGVSGKSVYLRPSKSMSMLPKLLGGAPKRRTRAFWLYRC